MSIEIDVTDLVRTAGPGGVVMAATYLHRPGSPDDGWQRNSAPHLGIETPEMLDRHPHARIWRWRDPQSRRRKLKPARVTR
jgi:hypothetical protein